MASDDVPDEKKYPERYALCDGGKRYEGQSTRSQAANDYLTEWHGKGYTGNYIPESLRDEDEPVELWDEDDSSGDLDPYLANIQNRINAALQRIDQQTPVLRNPPFGEDMSVMLTTEDEVRTEERATDPTTGGQKGRKTEEFALVPAWPREEEARVYGEGAKKYEPWNWARGYPWSWSLSALYRHIAKFERGESLDPESRLHHLAHAKFHLNTLMEFERLGLGTDDRWKQ